MKKLLLTILLITNVIFISKAQTWMPTNLTSETINCMSAEGTTLFVGTNNGVFKSIDFGVSWTNISNGITNLSITSLDVDGLKMFVGTNGGGLFLSTDGGLNWNPVNSGLFSLTINAVMISGTNLLYGDNIWGGLYISTNNGGNWTMVNGGLGLPTSVIKNFGSIGSNIVCNALGSGVYVSTDNGFNWIASTLINTTTNYLYGFTTDGANIYVGSAGDGVLLSTDNGLNFIKKYVGPNIGIRDLAFNGSVAYGTDPSAYGMDMTTDSCTSFTIYNTGLPNYAFYSVERCGAFIFTGHMSGQGVWKLAITPTDIKKTVSDYDLNIFPIPTLNQLSINTELEFNEISIIDITGKTIKTIKQNTNTINVADLSKGIYFIKLVTDEGTITKKFVKQ